MLDVGLTIPHCKKIVMKHFNEPWTWTNTGEKWDYNETVHYLFRNFKKAYDLVRMEVLYNFLFEFGVPMKLVRLIKM
jgi:hypothetical protein